MVLQLLTAFMPRQSYISVEVVILKCANAHAYSLPHLLIKDTVHAYACLMYPEILIEEQKSDPAMAGSARPSELLMPMLGSWQK